MPIGAGTSAAGVSIGGYGSVDQAPAQQAGCLIDAVTGLQQNARKIDPYTGRYVLDTYGRVQGMSGVQQLVEMRAGTILNSSAVAGLGLAPPDGVVRADTETKLTKAVVACMQDLIDQGLIQVVRVYLQSLPGGKYHRFFTWKDLSSAGPNQGVEQRTAF